MATPQIIKNLATHPVKLSDFYDFDGRTIILQPGETLDLFTRAADEDIARSPHIKKMVELGLFQVIKTFSVADTQADATAVAHEEAATAQAGSNGLRSTTTVVNTSLAPAPSAGQILTATDGTHAHWVTPVDNDAEVIATSDLTDVSGAVNAANGLVKLDGLGKLPAIDGSALTGIASGSSQWLDSGSDIYFSVGNVGIGTTPDATHKLLIYNAVPPYNMLRLAVSPFDQLDLDYTSVSSSRHLYLNSNAGSGYGTYISGVFLDYAAGSLFASYLGVGIGTTAPTAELDVVGDASLGTSALIRTTDYGTGPGFSMYAAAGTKTVPAAVTANYPIGFIGVKGFDGTDFSLTGSRAAIQMFATENWTPSAQGSSIRFRVTAPGTVANTNNALFIRAVTTGVPQVGIGTNNPSAMLHVAGTIAVGGLLEYADNAAAMSAGLTAGAFYRTGDILKVVH